MKFRKLANYFSELEKTASRNEMTEILAQLFGEASGEEIDKICYLALGRLAPQYAGVEFNLAEKLMIRAVALAAGLPGEEVRREYKMVGDLGKVVYKLKVISSKFKVKDLSVTEVYQKLWEIAQDAGEGSVERKINKMAVLINDLDALGAKYVVRIPLGKLRMGFSDLTILDALSWMITGDKSKRVAIEATFSVRADIGQIAQIIKKKGIRGLKGIGAQLGVPIVPALCQRLPNPEEMIKKMGKVAVEPKYDGQRCLGGMTGIYIFDKGFVPIRDIKKGDLVLTHHGRFKQVIAVKKRKIEKREKIFRFQTFLGNEFKITEAHPLLVFRKGKFIWESTEKIKKEDWLAFPRPNIRNSLRFPKYLDFIDGSGYKKKIILSKNFFRFLGFWIGDGFTNVSHGNKRVGISFNAQKEKKLAYEYKKIVNQVLGIKKISIENRGGAINLYWRDGLFQHWLCKEFRIDQHGKTIPQWFANMPPSYFEAFLKGWIEADGTARHSDGVRLTTKERELASFGQLLALQFGKIVGLRRETIKIPHKNYSLPYYSLIFPGTNKYAFWEKDFLIVKILKIERMIKPDSGMVVYNLQVADDESYLTSLAVLHNCQIHADLSSKKGLVMIFTRNLENVTPMFPDLVKALPREVKTREVILDGEAIGFDPQTGKFLAFQETIKRKRKYEIGQTAKEIPLKYFVFDILYKDGQDLLMTPFSQRRRILEKTILTTAKTIVLSPQIVTESAAELRKFHEAQIEKGLEGVVVKKWQSPYDPGRRGFTWVKFKNEATKKGGGLADTLDGVVMGYYKGKGKRADFGVGAFLVGIREGDKFLTLSKIGTGLTDVQWRELKIKSEKLKVKRQPKEYRVDKNLAPDIWCEPGLVVEIQADNITRSPIHSAGLALRFPRLVRFRDDKSADQATTLAEARKLYQLQWTV